MSSGHLLLSCAKRAATTKIDLFAYLWQLPCALCSLILMTLTLWGAYHSGKTEKKGPPEARQKRPRRNESLQARLLILCARFFLSKPQTEFAVWVFSMQICDNLSVSAAPSQHPYPFCPFGTFPPDRGNRPLPGEPWDGVSLPERRWCG